MTARSLICGAATISLFAFTTGGAQAGTRGRDPWALRMILENKMRMLVLAQRGALMCL